MEQKTAGELASSERGDVEDTSFPYMEKGGGFQTRPDNSTDSDASLAAVAKRRGGAHWVAVVGAGWASPWRDDMTLRRPQHRHLLGGVRGLVFFWLCAAPAQPGDGTNEPTTLGARFRYRMLFLQGTREMALADLKIVAFRARRKVGTRDEVARHEKA